MLSMFNWMDDEVRMSCQDQMEKMAMDNGGSKVEVDKSRSKFEAEVEAVIEGSDPKFRVRSRVLVPSGCG